MTAQAPDDQRLRILLIDDVPLMRSMLRRLLESRGLEILASELGVREIEVVEAGDGQEAIEQLNKSSFDLMFLDLMLPQVNGIELLTQLAEDPFAPSVPTIICSALTGEEVLRRARDLGACAYITKPFELVEVETALHQFAAMAKTT